MSLQSRKRALRQSSHQCADQSSTMVNDLYRIECFGPPFPIHVFPKYTETVLMNDFEIDTSRARHSCNVNCDLLTFNKENKIITNHYDLQLKAKNMKNAYFLNRRQDSF